MTRVKGISNPYIFEEGSVKYLRVPIRCPNCKSSFFLILGIRVSGLKTSESGLSISIRKIN